MDNELVEEEPMSNWWTYVLKPLV